MNGVLRPCLQLLLLRNHKGAYMEMVFKVFVLWFGAGFRGNFRLVGWRGSRGVSLPQPLSVIEREEDVGRLPSTWNVVGELIQNRMTIRGGEDCHLSCEGAHHMQTLTLNPVGAVIRKSDGKDPLIYTDTIAVGKGHAGTTATAKMTKGTLAHQGTPYFSVVCWLPSCHMTHWAKLLHSALEPSQSRAREGTNETETEIREKVALFHFISRASFTASRHKACNIWTCRVRSPCLIP